MSSFSPAMAASRLRLNSVLYESRKNGVLMPGVHRAIFWDPRLTETNPSGKRARQVHYTPNELEAALTVPKPLR